MHVTKYASHCKRHINQRSWRWLKKRGARLYRRRARQKMNNGEYDFQIAPTLTGWDVI
jgi:hypothetical protein